MIERILLGIATLVLLGVLIVGGILGWAHYAIRQSRLPLPGTDAVLAAGAEGGPLRLTYINTASQEMPRSGVLDPAQDPWPQEPYVMSHPSFVLEWEGGKLLLVDAGMSREAATDFGTPIEMLAGGQPIRPLGSVAERLGKARQRVAGAVFTHLHTDHVGGIAALCDTPQPIPVFMTAAQAEHTNYTTRPGMRILQDSPCVEARQLPDSPLAALREFPGVYVIAAGGHTPGSQIIIANLRTANGARRVAFIGDIVNNIDGITYNVPKPFFYSLLMVPEDLPRLDELRRWLRALRDTHGVQLVVAHDQRELERSGIAAWPGG